MNTDPQLPRPPTVDHGPSGLEPMVPLPREALDCGNGVKLWVVRIPAAGRSFLMGSPESEPERKDDETQHEVRFTRDWWMGVYPVTQAQYAAVMGENPSGFKGDDLPVETVSWDDASEFCRRLSAGTGRAVRLPTEAEWEFSCRAGTSTAMHFGDSLSSWQANFDGDWPYDCCEKGPNIGKTSAVGSYPPNGFGLYDVHGNVWEWCADWYGEYPTGPASDPHGHQPGKETYLGRLLNWFLGLEELAPARVVRGGSWRYFGWHCRCAVRFKEKPGFRYNFLGFRVAVSCT